MIGPNGLTGLSAQIDDFGLEVIAQLAIGGIVLDDVDTEALIQRMRAARLSASLAVIESQSVLGSYVS